MSEQQLDCALDLMRRLPPQQIEKNLSDLIDLVSSWTCRIHRSGFLAGFGFFLFYGFARLSDATVRPVLPPSALPSFRKATKVVQAKETLPIKRPEPGPQRPSFYLCPLVPASLVPGVLGGGGGSSPREEPVRDEPFLSPQEKSSGRTAHYKLTSTVMLWLQTNKTGSGTMNLGGSLTRQMEKDETVSDSSPHIANIGRLVEDMENKIRSTLNEIYFGKTKDIVNGLRSIDAIPDNQKYKQLQRELSQVLTQRQMYIQPDN
uniref:F-actin-capping protein subunit beta n=1 Tax=Pseudonaja textilis TaxID=8673 RepID=A0A670Z069_PSETE